MKTMHILDVRIRFVRQRRLLRLLTTFISRFHNCANFPFSPSKEMDPVDLDQPFESDVLEMVEENDRILTGLTGLCFVFYFLLGVA